MQHAATHCNTLQHTATHCYTTAAQCSTLQHTATQYNALQPKPGGAPGDVFPNVSRALRLAHCNTVQHTATHCNTLQHTATRCNTLHHNAAPLRHIATQYKALQPKPGGALGDVFPNVSGALKLAHYNTLQHTATHCNLNQVGHSATFSRMFQAYSNWHTATHCNTLQHTATHCNTLQHTATHCNILQPKPGGALGDVFPNVSGAFEVERL